MEASYDIVINQTKRIKGNIMKRLLTMTVLAMTSAFLLAGCTNSFLLDKPAYVKNETQDNVVYTNAVGELQPDRGYYEITCYDNKTVFVLNGVVCYQSDFNEVTGENEYSYNVKLLKVTDAGTDNATYTYVINTEGPFDVSVFGEYLNFYHVMGDGTDRRRLNGDTDIDDKKLGYITISWDKCDNYTFESSYIQAYKDCPDEAYEDKEVMAEYLSECFVPSDYKFKKIFASPQDRYDILNILTMGDLVCIIDDVIYTEDDFFGEGVPPEEDMFWLDHLVEDHPTLSFPLYYANIGEGLDIKILECIYDRGENNYWVWKADRTGNQNITEYFTGNSLTSITYEDGELKFSYEKIDEDIPSRYNQDDLDIYKRQIAAYLKKNTGKEYYISEEQKKEMLAQKTDEASVIDNIRDVIPQDRSVDDINVAYLKSRPDMERDFDDVEYDSFLSYISTSTPSENVEIETLYMYYTCNVLHTVTYLDKSNNVISKREYYGSMDDDTPFREECIIPVMMDGEIYIIGLDFMDYDNNVVLLDKYGNQVWGADFDEDEARPRGIEYIDGKYYLRKETYSSTTGWKLDAYMDMETLETISVNSIKSKTTQICVDPDEVPFDCEKYSHVEKCATVDYYFVGSKDGSQWGYLDADGKEIAMYDEATAFTQSGFALVLIDGYYRIIDKDFNVSDKDKFEKRVSDKIYYDICNDYLTIKYGSYDRDVVEIEFK